MTFRPKLSCLFHLAAATLCLISFQAAVGQGTFADYERAHSLQEKARHLVVNTPGPVTWIGNTDNFWYPKTVKGGTEFVLGQADAGTQRPAFDQEKLATAISKATGHTYTALNLPFAPTQGRPGARPVGAIPRTAPLTFLDGTQAIQFGTDGSLYKCQLSDYTCTKTGPIPVPGEGRPGASYDEAQLNPEADLEGPGGDPVDGLEFQPPAPQDGDEGRFEHIQRPCAQRPPSQSRGGQGRGQRLSVGSHSLASFRRNRQRCVLRSTASGKPSFKTTTSS